MIAMEYKTIPASEVKVGDRLLNGPRDTLLVEKVSSEDPGFVTVECPGVRRMTFSTAIGSYLKIARESHG